MRIHIIYMEHTCACVFTLKRDSVLLVNQTREINTWLSLVELQDLNKPKRLAINVQLQAKTIHGCLIMHYGYDAGVFVGRFYVFRGFLKPPPLKPHRWKEQKDNWKAMLITTYQFKIAARWKQELFATSLAGSVVVTVFFL